MTLQGQRNGFPLDWWRSVEAWVAKCQSASDFGPKMETPRSVRLSVNVEGKPMVKNGYPFVLNGCIRFVLVDVLPYHLVSLAVCCIWVNAYNTSERDQRPFNKILQNKLLRLDLSNLSNQWNIICMSTYVYIYVCICTYYTSWCGPLGVVTPHLFSTGLNHWALALEALGDGLRKLQLLVRPRHVGLKRNVLE